MSTESTAIHLDPCDRTTKNSARSAWKKREAKGSPSLRASEGCVAIHPTESVLYLDNGSLLTTVSGKQRVLNGLLRWLHRRLKPQANILIIEAAQPPRNDDSIQDNKSARSAHKGPIATLVLRLAMNATARACAEERGLPRRALVSPLRSVASLGLAFTMAEILLSLTIIGVVAAITLPSLTGNINERTWNTQRVALYARFSQAIALMPSLNQYSNSETFVTSGLAKVLKINNICGNANMTDCGITSKNITNLVGSTTSMPLTIEGLNSKNVSMSFFDNVYSQSYNYSNDDIPGVAFETGNGESLIAFYNPRCQANMLEDKYYAQTKVCASFVYDLNGSKGPNTVGKDIGVITVFYPSDSVVVSPMPSNKNVLLDVAWDNGMSACTQQEEGYRIPNRYELMAMFYNQDLLGGFVGRHYWSSEKYDPTHPWYQSGTTGQMKHDRLSSSTSNKAIRCVKR